MWRGNVMLIVSGDRFKRTPELVSAFEARRLPRPYLVLLERLLSVNPAGRPTCERVLSAIREGQVRGLFLPA